MKKKILSTVLAALLLTITACGDSASSASKTTEATVSSISIKEDPIVVSVSEPEPEPEPEENHDGQYRSELTNEWISEDIKDQRPIAVMVDNEKVALPHYGTSEADIVYELVNSYKNDYITRLMCIFKDWKNVPVIGNVRSARPTNIILFPEYNAILIHDGGPHWINDWLKYDIAKHHFSGGFARIDRGKADFYEEYVTTEDHKGTEGFAGKTYVGLVNRIKKAGFGEEYNKYYMGEHFTFSDKEFSLEDEAKAQKAENIELPFPHNKSNLKYNKETKTYDYYEYGELYTDAAAETEKRMSFKNLIIYSAKLIEQDENGYMIYGAIDSGEGYYITNGYAIPIKWKKAGMDKLTEFTNAKTGEPITLNTGKTYISIVPTDFWKKLVIE